MTTPLVTETGLITVRRIRDVSPWYVAAGSLNKVASYFVSGLLTDVVFDPRAKVMKDVFCGTDRVSEATATGTLSHVNEDPPMPSEAVRKCFVDYDPESKVFHEKGKPEETITACDFLVLQEAGSAIAGWKR